MLSPATVRLVAQGMAQLSWNRSAGSLLAWERYATARDTPFLPACPAHFADFLAESAEGARSYSQTKSSVCAINALCLAARLPSPSKMSAKYAPASDAHGASHTGDYPRVPGGVGAPLPPAGWGASASPPRSGAGSRPSAPPP